MWNVNTFFPVKFNKYQYISYILHYILLYCNGLAEKSTEILCMTIPDFDSNLGGGNIFSPLKFLPQVHICYLIFTPWSLFWELRKVKLRSKRSNVTIKIISRGFIILNSIVFYLLKFSTVGPNCFSQYSVVADYKIFYLIFIFLHSKYVHISRKSSHKIGVLAQQSTVYIPKFFIPSKVW